MKQSSFKYWKQNLSYGGDLRRKRAGRSARPLSTKNPIHLVFKANREVIGLGLRSHKRFSLVQHLLRLYSKKFFVKIEQFSIQNDHIHLLIRGTKRSELQHFFRVLAGQIAQRFELEELILDPLTGTPKGSPENEAENIKLWKHRPFTRIVKGWKAYKIMKDYIQLNEKEGKGAIKYKKDRLRGLNPKEYEELWR